jgi:hypothetical protein
MDLMVCTKTKIIGVEGLNHLADFAGREGR